MDEIAAQADVSKVTIYKYFHSKEELYKEVIDLYVDELLAATEKVIDSDLDFIEKLKITMLAQATSPQLADSRTLFELLDRDEHSTGDGQGILKGRIREIMYKVYEEGKRTGYIDESLSFDLLNVYSDIFQAGFKAKTLDTDLKTILADPAAFEQLLHLFFFGMIRRNGN